jgi:hypothetical protein
MAIIDSHCHVGTGVRKQVPIEELLRQMDSARVARAVICTVDQFIAVRIRGLSLPPDREAMIFARNADRLLERRTAA